MSLEYSVFLSLTQEQKIDLVCKAIQKAGGTQFALAHKMRVHQPYISMWKKGVISFQNLYKIIEFLESSEA